MNGVNRDAIEFRIGEINDAIGMLREILSKPFDDLSPYERLSMRYLIIQLVEAAASISMHLLMRLFNETSDGFPDCFMRIGRRGIIPMDLASNLASAARLRNLLIHRYWTIEDGRVYNSVMDGLRDFEDFIRRVREVLRDV